MPLLVHGEVTDPGDRPVRSREGVHRPRDDAAAPRFSGAEGGVRAHHDEGCRRVRARGRAARSGQRSPRTICCTTAMRSLSGGIRPHYYCLPVLKRETHRVALRRGGDVGQSAFFPRHGQRAASEGAEGARVRLRGLLHRAARARALHRSLRQSRRARQARRLRELPRAGFLRPCRAAPRTVTLRRETWTLPAEFMAGDEEVVPLRGGESIGWRQRLRTST